MLLEDGAIQGGSAKDVDGKDVEARAKEGGTRYIVIDMYLRVLFGFNLFHFFLATQSLLVKIKYYLEYNNS